MDRVGKSVALKRLALAFCREDDPWRLVYFAADTFRPRAVMYVRTGSGGEVDFAPMTVSIGSNQATTVSHVESTKRSSLTSSMDGGRTPSKQPTRLDVESRASRCILGCMRTTVDLAPDVLAAIEMLQQERHLGRSEAVNELVRAGMVVSRPREPFVQRTMGIGVLVDVSNVAEALEALEGPVHR